MVSSQVLATGPNERVDAVVPDFASVYAAHASYTLRCLRRLGVAEAALDDATQEVFIVVHRRLHEYEPRAAMRTWIYAIALRVARDHRRGQRRRGASEALSDEITDPAAGPLEGASANEARRVLERLLDGLDEDKREALVLMELEEMTAPEAAEALGVNQNTLYARLRAARMQLERAIAKYQGRAR
jgi:RNA polymerase sigma-70 factor (ECF subfamily)